LVEASLFAMKGEIGIQIEPEFQECIDAQWVRKLAQEALKAESIASPYEMSLVFTDSETVRRLNRDYRGIDEPTDVLAFYMLPQQSTDSDFQPTDYPIKCPSPSLQHQKHSWMGAEPLPV